MLESRGLYQTDGKRPDGVTMIPWKMCEQLVWDVTLVDALAPSRLSQSTLCNLGTAATEAEARKFEKYHELRDNGYIFQPVAMEVQGSLGESSEIFITRLCKMLCRSLDNQRAGSFLKLGLGTTFNGITSKFRSFSGKTSKDLDVFPVFLRYYWGVGGSRSKERDRKSELVLRSAYQIFEWDRNNSDRTFYNIVRYVHIPLVP